ncbi:NAD(P)/FAD-dependent oxidoreductase [Pseudonocardia xinjiangensis]|uniref:NAD(P)-binding protein n=1 Tax=Pseudonocardia xinjiangensis TaxID=75289 RepID=A0ABX1RDB7_9PSEU|nr:FAD-dependent oxidoreductase [Pseudonocardia xinjiangensis]NMH77874.1 NAD(P)-binding protein [Pseudonocardia xinjiangensis]
MSVLVVGAGLAGVACAVELTAAGVPVQVLERAASVGGRMASRTVHGRPVDIGAAYFTVRDPEFAEVVARWRTAGLARPWTSELAVLGDGTRGRSPGPVRWAAPHGLASLVAELASGLAVELEHEIHHVGPGPVVDGRPADVVVLAMPDPQALRLLDPASPAVPELAGREWRPVITVVAGWPSREWPEMPAAFVNDHPVLSLIADDGDRRGDGAAVLVAHTTADAARRHERDPAGAVGPVVGAVRELLDVPTAPSWTAVHRWDHAAPAAARDQPFHLGDDGIAVAGDSWGSSRVETAWRSGTLLGRAVAARLGAAQPR